MRSNRAGSDQTAADLQPGRSSAWATLGNPRGGWHKPDELLLFASADKINADAEHLAALRALPSVGSTQERLEFPGGGPKGFLSSNR